MKKYLTMEEKKQLVMQGKEVPLCVSTTSYKNKNSFICKIRSIWDGSRKNKKMKI